MNTKTEKSIKQYVNQFY